MPSSGSHASAERPPRGVFRLQLLIGGCGLVAMVAAVAATAEAVHRRPAGAHRLAVAGVTVTYPALNLAAAVVLSLALLGAFVLLTAVAEACRQVRAARGLVRHLPVLGPLPCDPDVSVVDDPRPEAFCAGFLCPRVYVSRGTLAVLDDGQLRAVLEHEHHHRRRRDPLRLAFALVLRRALFFLPVLRPLHDRHVDLAELHADRAAVRAEAGGRASLAAALLTFDATAPPGGGISPHRVDALLGTAARWRAPAALMGLGVATLASLALVVWRAGQAASATVTFDLPVLSSQPCVLMLALVPLGASLAAAAWRPGAAR